MTPGGIPSWLPGRTLYHLHALGAAAGRGFAHVTGWLDYIAELRRGAVLLTPVHHSSTHGYDTVDPFALDPRLGTDDDWRAFVDACRARDLRIVLDGVFNHVGRTFARADWLSGTSWEGHDALPELDHDNPEVLVWAVDVARHWLDCGADGWRFDVAYRIPRPFLHDLHTAIRTSHPDAFLFGEMIAGDFAGLVRDGGLHSATQYELFKAIWSLLNDANFWELAHALTRHAGLCASFPPVTFLGNHDVTRMRSQLRNDRHLEHALAILYTVPGVPCIYYGDELGFSGARTVGAGGDDAIRQPLPDRPERLDVDERFQRWIAFRRDRPELTTATLEILDKTNRTITYQTGDLAVSIDVDGGVSLG